MADDAKVLADAAKLPLDEQLAHSSWKVRAQALATIQERVQRAFSLEDGIFAEAGELGEARTATGAAQAAALRSATL